MVDKIEVHLHSFHGQAEPALAPGPGTTERQEPRRQINSVLSIQVSEVIGRQSDSQAILAHLLNRRSLCICGIVGIGKTTLLSYVLNELTRSHPQAYSEVCFDRMVEDGTSQERLTRLLLQLTIQLDRFAEFDATKPEIAIERLHRMMMGRNVLFAIDNADEPQSVQATLQLHARLPQLTIVVTSRSYEWQDMVRVELKGIAEQAGIQLFEQAYGGLPEAKELVREIWRVTEGHPMAIEHLALEAKASPSSLGALVGRNRGFTVKGELDARFRNALDRLPKECMQIARAIAIFRTTHIQIPPLVQISGSSLSELKQMEQFRLLVIQADAAAVTIHELFRAWCQSALLHTDPSEVRLLIRKLASYYTAFLHERKQCGPAELAEIDTEWPNLLTVMDRSEDPQLFVNLVIALIGYSHDDPGGYVSRRGLTSPILERSQTILKQAETIGGLPAASVERNLGLFAYWRGQHTLAAELVVRARDRYVELDYAPGIASTTWLLGYLADDENRYSDALAVYKKGLKVAEQIGDLGMMALGHHLVGCTLYHQAHYEVAEQEFQRARQLVPASEFPDLHARIRRRLGYLDLELGNYEQAERSLMAVREECVKLNRQRDLARTERHMGVLYLRTNDLPKSEKYFTLALTKFREQGAKSGEGATLLGIAKLRRRQKEFAEAQQLCRESVGIAVQTRSIFGIAAGQEEMGAILAAQNGAPQEVLKHKHSAMNAYKIIGHVREGIVKTEIESHGGYHPEFPKLQGVILDLMDTLACLTPNIYDEVKQKIARQLGISPDLYAACWSRSRIAASTGIFQTVEDRCCWVIQQLALEKEIPPSAVPEIAEYEKQIWREHVHLYPDSLDSLRSFRAMGLKVGIVCNGSVSMSDLSKTLGLTDLIDAFILSCEVAILKPEPKIYHYALQKLGISAKDCIYIGDGNDRELDGAKKVGLFTLRIHRSRADYADPSNQSLDWDIEVKSLSEVVQMIRATRGDHRATGI